MISGTPFQIVDAGENWAWIGPMVEGVDPSDNAGHGLRRDCEDGKALCLVSDDGLLVVELQPDRNGNGLELFVRMTVARGAKGTIQRNDAHLDAIAREMGAKKIVFHTYRPGMGKVLSPNWRVQFTSFERAVK
jgi:hypothetical protein